MTNHTVLLIVIMALVTIFIRALPFLIFNKKTPDIILYLGDVLPYASIGMLVVYCFKDVVVTSAPYGLPELIASLIVIGLHVYKRNSLLSILGGTLSYMLLVQVIF